MNLRCLPPVILLLAGTAAQAGPGDAFEVTGNRVNMRAGPDRSAAVLRQVNAGARVIEEASDGDWLRVRLVESDQAGWIYKTLLIPRQGDQALEGPPTATLLAIRDHVIRQAAAPDRDVAQGETPDGNTYPLQPAPGRAASPGEEEVVLARRPVNPPIDSEQVRLFQKRVDYLNMRAQSIAGIKLFETVEPMGAGVVRIQTTSSWAQVPPVGQESYMTTLLDNWTTAMVSSGPSEVILVDGDGTVLMQKSRP